MSEFQVRGYHDQVPWPPTFSRTSSWRRRHRRQEVKVKDEATGRKFWLSKENVNWIIFWDYKIKARFTKREEYSQRLVLTFKVIQVFTIVSIQLIARKKLASNRYCSTSRDMFNIGHFKKSFSLIFVSDFGEWRVLAILLPDSFNLVAGKNVHSQIHHFHQNLSGLNCTKKV